MPGTTPVYGFPYPEPTDLVADYPALGQQLAEDVETTIAGIKSGFNLMNPTSIANTGGTATKSSNGGVTFAGASSVSLNGVFTSAYTNYRVILQFLGSADLTGTGLRLRASGTDATGASYDIQGWYAGTIAAATINNLGATSWVTSFASTGRRGIATYDFAGPNLAAPTTGVALINQPITAQITGAYASVAHQLSTAYDGLTLFTSSNNFTGSIAVYGYLG
jgi:hypothetical protein